MTARYDPGVRFALPLLLLFLTGCGGVALNVHNGTSAPITIDALDLTVEPGATARAERRSIPATLTARSAGADVETASIGAIPAGGEAVWVVGGGACFAEADYGSYYTSVDVPAGAVLVGSLGPDERVYVSKGRVRAGPGQMLPKRGGGAMRALVQVPCAASRGGDAVLVSWLEIKLTDIQPRD